MPPGGVEHQSSMSPGCDDKGHGSITGSARLAGVEQRQQEAVQGVTVARGQPREHLVFDRGAGGAQIGDDCFSSGGQRDAVAAPVLRVGVPFEQPSLAEAVDDAGDPVTVSRRGTALTRAQGRVRQPPDPRCALSRARGDEARHGRPVTSTSTDLRPPRGTLGQWHARRNTDEFRHQVSLSQHERVHGPGVNAVLARRMKP